MMVSGVVAEMSNSANGSLATAHGIIEACADAGVDWMKFQCYLPEELVKLRGGGAAPEPWDSEGWTMRDLYHKAQTPHEWFPTLIQKCEEVGLPWFSSVFVSDSLAWLEKLGCPVYKLASLDVGQDAFRREVIATGKPVIQSAAEVAHIEGVSVLWCPPGYPQKEINIQDLRNAMVACDGFSYHGTSHVPPKNALKYGAKIVEVHVQLDDEPSALESNCCISVSDLHKLTGKPGGNK